jgi:hypothetical protein
MKCAITGQDMVVCEHCLNDDYIEEVELGPEYETIGRAFRSQFRGVCAVDERHRVLKGHLVSRIQRADNPNILVTGVACKMCTVTLPKGKK